MPPLLLAANELEQLDLHPLLAPGTCGCVRELSDQSPLKQSLNVAPAVEDAVDEHLVAHDLVDDAVALVVDLAEVEHADPLQLRRHVSPVR